MNAATIAALRTMMREELNTILKDFEANVTSTIHDLQEELREERAAREKLEERI